MKKNLSRIISLGLSMTMIAGCTFATFGASDNTKESGVVAALNEENTDLNLSGILNESEADKQETVYVIAGADGEVKKIIVSELLKNPAGKNTIEDVTKLTGIENVKSDAAYVLNGESCVWDAAGEDIYYRGTTDEELPVVFNISFKLDGKTVTADEIAGKSGKVEMTVKYINNCTRKVVIDKKEETMHVPFLMLTGMILDNEKFSNIEIDNGKIINDGDKSIVAGYAVSGLSENLNNDSLKDMLASSFTIKADVKDFSLATTLTLATSEVFGKISLEDTDSADKLMEKIDLLDSSMKELADGSSTLYGYMQELSGATNELVQTIQTLTDYMQQISQGADSLYKDGILYVEDKLLELSDGLKELTGNSKDLNDGAKQVYETLLNTVYTQLKAAGLDALGIKVEKLTISNYEKELNRIIAALDEKKVEKTVTAEAKKLVTAQVKANEAAITEAVTQAVKEQVTQTIKDTVVKPQVLNAAGITAEQYNALSSESDTRKAIDSNIEAQMNSENVKAAIQTQMQSENIKKTIADNVTTKENELIDENMENSQVKNQIADAKKTAKEGKASVQAAKESLSAYNEFYTGVLAYTGGANTAAAGAVEIYKGYNENITEGMKTLSDSLHEYLAGISKLNETMPELKDSVTSLKDGTKTLNDGCNKFYNEGIKEVIGSIENIAPVITRLKASFDIASDYQSYGGISKDMTGETKFIYRTEAIN